MLAAVPAAITSLCCVMFLEGCGFPQQQNLGQHMVCMSWGACMHAKKLCTMHAYLVSSLLVMPEVVNSRAVLYTTGRDSMDGLA